MALTDEIQNGIKVLKDVASQAKDHKDEIQKAADALKLLGDALQRLVNGDPVPINIVMTQWSMVNKLLLARASAQSELDSQNKVDWAKLAEGLATVAGIVTKLAMAFA